MGRRIKIKIPAAIPIEQIVFEARKVALEETIKHEDMADPHPQYTTNAEVLALIPAPPRFVTYWKWS